MSSAMTGNPDDTLHSVFELSVDGYVISEDLTLSQRTKVYTSRGRGTDVSERQDNKSITTHERRETEELTTKVTLLVQTVREQSDQISKLGQKVQILEQNNQQTRHTIQYLMSELKSSKLQARKEQSITTHERRETEELTTKVTLLVQTVREQSDQISKLGQKVQILEQNNQETRHNIQYLMSELKSTKLQNRKEQLSDLDKILVLMLGFSMNKFAPANHEIITHLRKLIQAHDNTTQRNPSKTVSSPISRLRSGFLKTVAVFIMMGVVYTSGPYIANIIEDFTLTFSLDLRFVERSPPILAM